MCPRDDPQVAALIPTAGRTAELATTFADLAAQEGVHFRVLFWRDLPTDHAGEDVVVQWRIVAEYGGAGLLPSGAVHLESPTTLPVRTVDAPDLVGTR